MKKINLGAMVSDVTNHWKTPAEGKYISYGEFTAYSIGGIGSTHLWLPPIESR
ncbi:MAG: hypothetical protein K2I73_01180 [Eubacterium sp.]|nr:hypothetical protein [Eubacterium sp.]